MSALLEAVKRRWRATHSSGSVAGRQITCERSYTSCRVERWERATQAASDIVWQNLAANVRARLNFRLILASVIIAALAVLEVTLEHRPSFLRPGQHLYAYVGNAGDGTVSIVDLAGLSTIATVRVGPGRSALRPLASTNEIWGVSTEAGLVWVLDARTGKISAQIPIGGPVGLTFSPDGGRAYVTASNPNTLVAIDTATKKVAGRARAGVRPGRAAVTPDGRAVLVPNRDDSTLDIFDSGTLIRLATIGVAQHPEQVVVLPDSSAAFVASADTRQVSAIDLRRSVLVANLQLGGTPGRMFVKQDGGELYITVPESHGLEIINTWTTEIAESMTVGLTPGDGTLTADANALYISDAAAGRILPVAIGKRHLNQPINVGTRPGICTLDPSGELLLVANQDSNDLAVIRVRTSSLLTMVSVGSRPSDLAVLLF